MKVWKLKKEGLSFQDISASINEKTAAVKKQFRRAFEIIYGCKFSKEKYNELVIQLGDQSVCEKCPKRSKCTKPCEEIEKDLKSREKYQREKLGGDKSIEEMPEEFFDLLDDEIDNDDESDPKKYSLPDA